MSATHVVPFPLYHGTDKKIIDYTEKEREQIQALCLKISDCAYSLFCNDGMSISSLFEYKRKRLSKISDDWEYFIDAFQKYDSRKKGSNWYRYDSLYLTGDKSKAIGYAKNAFIMGEQGIVAYWLYKAASKIWQLEEHYPNMTDCFKKFEELIAEPHIPVVLAFHNIMQDDLLGERGDIIDWEDSKNFLSALSYRLRPESSTSIQDGIIKYL